MRRTLGILVAAATAVGVDAAGAQGTPIVGTLVEAPADGSGAAAGRRVVFFPHPGERLDGLCGWPSPAGPPASVATRSGADGRFGLVSPEASGDAVVGVVWVPSRNGEATGALQAVAPSAPEAPGLEVHCRPLHRVPLPIPGEVHLRLGTVVGSPYAGRRDAADAAVHLPEGRYRALVVGGDEVVEMAIRVPAAGAPVVCPTVHLLVDPGDGGDDAVAFLPGWPEVPLDGVLTTWRLGAQSARALQWMWLRSSAAEGGVLRDLWVREDGVEPPADAGPRGTLAVRDSEGRPVADARVFTFVESDGGAHRRALTWTDATGRARCVDPPVGVTGHAVVAHPAFAPRAVSLPRAEPVVLDRGTSVELQVVDEDGNGVPGIAVEMEWDRAPLLRSTWVTDLQGHVRRTRVTPGDVTVRVRDGERWAEPLAVTLRPGVSGPPTPRPLRLVARPGAQLCGRVVQPDGEPAAGAVVSIAPRRGEEPPDARSVRTDRAGMFRLGGLPTDAGVWLSARWLDPAHNAYLTSRVPAVAGSDADSAPPVTLQLRAEDPPLPGARHR